MVYKKFESLRNNGGRKSDSYIVLIQYLKECSLFSIFFLNGYEIQLRISDLWSPFFTYCGYFVHIVPIFYKLWAFFTYYRPFRLVQSLFCFLQSFFSPIIDLFAWFSHFFDLFSHFFGILLTFLLNSVIFFAYSVIFFYQLLIFLAGFDVFLIGLSIFLVCLNK